MEPTRPGGYARALYTTFVILSAVSFVGFGIGYLTWSRMESEFARYGLPRLRVPAAWLQIVGGAGQLAGLWFAPLTAAASGGLAVMMVIAIGVRLHIGDPIYKMLPATAYLALCVCLVVAALRR